MILISYMLKVYCFGDMSVRFQYELVSNMATISTKFFSLKFCHRHLFMQIVYSL